MTRVCALIPHYECEAWLGEALESVLCQTRALDGIVVIDDASPQPPVDIVREFPGVTLMSAATNSGPYRLIQSVIEATDFDAYLFQDADDWSAPDRLETLLAEAARHDAELVGSHEVRVLVDQGDLVPVRYALDVNAALAAKPTAFPLLHPTSLVHRNLVHRLGGFATGMRFSGDAEFLRRAGHAARVVNADHFGYFRRKRAGSLTMSAQTGFTSPQRLAVQETLRERARVNAERVAAGQPPDLRPWRTAAPVELNHLLGPAPGERSPLHGWSPPNGTPSAAGGPVVVVGPPRSGGPLLAWALGQHPHFQALLDSRWLARLATDVTRRAHDDAVGTPSDLAARLAGALDDLAGGQNRRWVASGSEATDAAWALAELFEDAKFIVVHRGVEDTVAALLAAPTDGGTFYTRDLASRRWVAATRTGLDLTDALGPERVLRLDHDELIGDPERNLRVAAAFLGAEFVPRCLRPFTGLEPQPLSIPEGESLPEVVAEQITDLAFRLAAPTATQSDEAKTAELMRAAQRRRSGLEAGGPSLVDRVRSVVHQAVPEGAVVIVVSKGDPRLTELAAAVGWHFPQVEGGTYAGHHPADSESAIAHLEQLRARGGEYLVLPASSFWWLTYYDDLRRHLENRYRVVAFQEEACIVYALTGTPGVLSSLPAVLAQASQAKGSAR